MILINGERFNDSEFHNGEVIFKQCSTCNDVKNTVEMIFKDNRDIANLMFAVKWLDDKYPDAKRDLIMRYCPYERMDREINDQLFSMKYFADIVGDMDFNDVYILDPHSEVCVKQLVDNFVRVHILNLTEYVKKVIEDFQPDYICYPDKGASSKYTKELSNIEIPSFFGSKKRDLSNNGAIVEYELVDAPELTDKKVLIIDDICCLGGTAYNAAVEMKKRGAKEVAFYISHCEDGIFAGKILKREPFYSDGSHENLPWADKYTIDKVYTADTMGLSDWHNNLVKID